MEAFLLDLLPRLLPVDLPRRVIDHGSKWQLLKRLPERLAGYGRIPAANRPLVLVLVDRDDDDCLALKQKLELAGQNAGLASKARVAPGATLDLVNRIVVEELEAWYFGDLDAVAAGWPGIAPSLSSRSRFRDPDAITGGTHEAFLAVLQQAGHLKGVTRLPKIDTARRMASLVDPNRNRSCSFNQFLSGLHALVKAA